MASARIPQDFLIQLVIRQLGDDVEAKMRYTSDDMSEKISLSIWK